MIVQQYGFLVHLHFKMEENEKEKQSIFNSIWSETYFANVNNEMS